ncbi:MAG: hypothetical protein GSR72_04270 [Desulfurococcales archaeon]|nr:hypothetical protein [Desulfurococcales archaeon]MEB3789088.1 hypothetical protein [Desulfurococcales archaeon]
MRVGAREKAEALSLALILFIVAVYLFVRELSLSQLVGLLIMAPSLVMLGYYVVSRERDKYYNVGLYTVLFLAGSYVYGLTTLRVVAGLVLVVIGVLIVVSYLRK